MIKKKIGETRLYSIYLPSQLKLQSVSFTGFPGANGTVSVEVCYSFYFIKFDSMFGLGETIQLPLKVHIRYGLLKPVDKNSID